MQYWIEKGKCGSSDFGVAWFQSPNSRIHPTQFPVDNHPSSSPWKKHTQLAEKSVNKGMPKETYQTASKVTGFWIMDFYYAESKVFFFSWGKASKQIGTRIVTIGF